MEDNKRNILNGQINKIQDVIDWLTINFNLLDVVDGVIFYGNCKKKILKTVFKVNMANIDIQNTSSNIDTKGISWVERIFSHP